MVHHIVVRLHQHQYYGSHKNSNHIQYKNTNSISNQYSNTNDTEAMHVANKANEIDAWSSGPIDTPYARPANLFACFALPAHSICSPR